MEEHGTARHQDAPFRDLRHPGESCWSQAQINIHSRIISSTTRSTRAANCSQDDDDASSQHGTKKSPSADQYAEHAPPKSSTEHFKYIKRKVISKQAATSHMPGAGVEPRGWRLGPSRSSLSLVGQRLLMRPCTSLTSQRFLWQCRGIATACRGTHGSAHSMA